MKSSTKPEIGVKIARVILNSSVSFHVKKSEVKVTR